jgi:hypothetical protein
VLVEGDYCTKVEHQCDKSWYGVNKKTVCEKFRPTAKCVGQRARSVTASTSTLAHQKGERPEVMNNFYQAQVKCAAAGAHAPRAVDLYRRSRGKHPQLQARLRSTAAITSGMAPTCRRWRAAIPELADCGRACVRRRRVRKAITGVNDLPATPTKWSPARRRSASGASSTPSTRRAWYEGVRSQCRPRSTHDDGFYYLPS